MTGLLLQSPSSVQPASLTTACYFWSVCSHLSNLLSAFNCFFFNCRNEAMKKFEFEAWGSGEFADKVQWFDCQGRRNASPHLWRPWTDGLRRTWSSGSRYSDLHKPNRVLRILSYLYRAENFFCYYGRYRPLLRHYFHHISLPDHPLLCAIISISGSLQYFRRRL